MKDEISFEDRSVTLVRLGRKVIGEIRCDPDLSYRYFPKLSQGRTDGGGDPFPTKEACMKSLLG